MQHKDLRRLDSISIANLNFENGKNNAIFIKIIGQIQRQEKVIFN